MSAAFTGRSAAAASAPSASLAGERTGGTEDDREEVARASGVEGEHGSTLGAAWGAGKFFAVSSRSLPAKLPRRRRARAAPPRGAGLSPLPQRGRSGGDAAAGGHARLPRRAGAGAARGTVSAAPSPGPRASSSSSGSTGSASTRRPSARAPTSAAVCRCFPGKTAQGGDRVPSPAEVEACSAWMRRELDLLRPELVIPVGKLAIAAVPPRRRRPLRGGRQVASAATAFGHETDIIPLPHPSGASTWFKMEPGRTLTARALRRIGRHPAWAALRA